MKQLLNLHIDFVKNFKNTQYLDSHIYKGIDEEILQNSKRYEKVYPNKLVVIIKNNVPHIKRNLPIITILLYFIGFIVYTTHQESYKIHAFELLNGQYLKSGLLFSFIFLPPFLLNLYTQIEFHKISANRFMSRVFGVGMVIYYVTIICSIVITIVELSTAKLLIAGIFFTFLTLYFRFLVFSPYGNVVFLTSLAPIH